ncbi:hypothetical protein [Actinoplanes sp. NPDC051859]|uniref:hypothetical protein n=1 Tax=Actinoplanes sp. NPDC051859 TaxID=3363909 RepID=UPI0037A5A5C8
MAADLGWVGAFGQVEAEAVCAGRGGAQGRVADAVDFADRGEDGVDVEALLAFLRRQDVTSTQVRRDAGQRGGLGRGFHGRRLRNGGHVRLGRDALRQSGVRSRSRAAGVAGRPSRVCRLR